MIEAALVVLLAAVIVFHGWSERRHAADRNRLVAALLSRNAGEYAAVIAAEDRPKPRTKSREEIEAGMQIGSS